jgi:hypothetical protein
MPLSAAAELGASSGLPLPAAAADARQGAIRSCGGRCCCCRCWRWCCCRCWARSPAAACGRWVGGYHTEIIQDVHVHAKSGPPASSCSIPAHCQDTLRAWRSAPHSAAAPAWGLQRVEQWSVPQRAMWLQLLAMVESHLPSDLQCFASCVPPQDATAHLKRTITAECLCVALAAKSAAHACLQSNPDARTGLQQQTAHARGCTCAND